MATVRYVEEKDANDQVRKVYDDIKQVFGLVFVPNLFKAMFNGFNRFIDGTLIESDLKP